MRLTPEMSHDPAEYQLASEPAVAPENGQPGSLRSGDWLAFFMDQTKIDYLDCVLSELRAEVLRAMAKHKPMNSPHEGYAVIQEEVDELWDRVKTDTGRDYDARVEALQIAAMGLRYIVDLRPNGSG